MRFTVVLVAALIASDSTAFAQSTLISVSDGAGRTVAGPVEEGPLHAAVRRIGAHPAGSPSLIPQTSPHSSWVVRHPVVAGTLAGVGTGAVLSRTRTFGGLNQDPRIMLVGAGVGAWGGLIASAVHKARAREKVSLGEKIGIAAGAVAIVVLPLLACYGAGGCGGAS